MISGDMEHKEFKAKHMQRICILLVDLQRTLVSTVQIWRGETNLRNGEERIFKSVKAAPTFTDQCIKSSEPARTTDKGLDFCQGFHLHLGDF